MLQHDKKYIKEKMALIMGTFITPFNRILKSLNRFKLSENIMLIDEEVESEQPRVKLSKT